MKLPFNFIGKARVEARVLDAQKENGSKGELFLYGVVSDEKYFESDITPQDVKREMDKLASVKKIDMYVNSPGGSVTAGTAIYNIIKRDSATITAHVDAMAASIMSVIVQAADVISIPKNAFMFIHNPWTIAVGDSVAFRKLADELQKFEAALSGMYSRYKGKPEDLAAMMEEETLLSGEEAVAMGFADVLEESTAMAASMTGTILNIGGNLIDTSVFKKIPLDKVLGAVHYQKPQEEKPADPAPADMKDFENKQRLMCETQLKINQSIF